LSAIRTRWAAIGAAVAVSIGGGGLFMAQAADSTSDSAYHPVTPVRVLDTRASGAITNGATKLKVEGTINTINADGTTTSQEVVPSSASAVAINVTVTEGAKNGGYGFVKAYPCSATTDVEPNASAINFENNVDIANGLNVTTSSTGEICLSVYGSADLIVDVAGYYDDSRLDAIEADYIDNDASYTISFLPKVTRDSNDECVGYEGVYNIFSTYFPVGAPCLITYDHLNMELEMTNGAGFIGFDIPPYISSFGKPFGSYRLKSVSICIPASGNASGGYIADVLLYKGGSSTQISDFAALEPSAWSTSADCEFWEIPSNSRGLASPNYRVGVTILDSNGGNDGDVKINQVIATFEPYTFLNLTFPSLPVLPFEAE